jgi:MinD-like ATPase involved in chromosome partitioning or flagellar assembly
MNPTGGQPYRRDPIVDDVSGGAKGPGLEFRSQVRLVVGLGDPERTARLLPGLCAAGDVALVEHCLTADRLLECVRAGRADAVLVAADLHRLGGERLEALARAEAAVVVLAPDPDAPRWRAFPTPVLPVGADPHLVRETLTAALHGPALPRGAAAQAADTGGARPAGAQRAQRRGEAAGRGATDPAGARPVTPAAAKQTPPLPQAHAAGQVGATAGTDADPTPDGTRPLSKRPAADSEDHGAAPGATPAVPGFVLAVCSGHGSPGSTTVAVNLAVALGAAVPTIIVDAALVAPGVAAALRLSRTRSLVMLAHDDPRTPEEWDRALTQETQSLTARSPYGRALCGVPKPALRAAVSVPFVAELVARLRERFRYVVLDLGDVADLVAAAPLVAGAQRAALVGADHVCLVARPDPVGVWRAQEARDALWGHAAVAPEQTSLVVNHYDRRRHHRRGEIEWALGVPASAVVPHDHGRVQQALGELRPVVLDQRSAAGRALLDFAERAFGGRLTLPPEPSANGTRRATGGVVCPSRLWPVGWVVRARHLLERMRSLVAARGAPYAAAATRPSAGPPAAEADTTGTDRMQPEASAALDQGRSEYSSLALPEAGADGAAVIRREGVANDRTAAPLA